MALEDVPFAIRPFYVVDRRIEYHCQAEGSLLEGLKYDREGKIDASGDKDLPFIQPITINDEEGHAVGAGHGVENIQTFYFLIGSKRENGLFRRNYTTDKEANDYEEAGVMDWVGRVRDAIETKADGTEESDPLLDGTISTPFLTAIREAPVSDMTWCMLLEVSFVIPSTCRGQRSQSTKEIGNV